MKLAIFLKSSLLFNSFIVFSVYKKTLRLNNLKTRTAMDAKISVFVVSVKLYHLHDCTFKQRGTEQLFLPV